MALREVLTTQEDFAGEWRKTSKTQALWHFNERNSDFHEDTPKVAEERMQSTPTGYPRYEVDGLDESKTVFKHNFDGTDPDLELIGNASIIDTDGAFRGKCLDFSNGGTAYLPPIPELGTQSIAVVIWFKPTAADLDGDWHVIATQRTAGDRGYHFGIYNRGLVVRAYNASGTMLVNSASAFAQLTADQWYCAIFTHDTSNWRIFLNGDLRQSGTYSGGPVVYSATNWEFGTMGGGYQFYGRIGGMFVFKDYWTSDAYYPHVYETVQLTPSDMTITTVGAWELEFNLNDSGAHALTIDSEGSVSLEFTGSGIEWITRTGPEYGIAAIYIDETLVTTVDCYSPTPQFKQVLFSQQNLTYGVHTVRIEWTGEKNASASSSKIAHDAFRVTPGLNEIADASGYGRHLQVFGWSGTTAQFIAGRFGNYLRVNTSNPATEKTYLKVPNSGDLFTNLGKKFVIGGYIVPTYYGVATTFVPLVSTRDGPGAPFFYMAIQTGRINVRLYDASGGEIYNTTETGYTLTAGQRYFVCCILDLENKTVQVGIADMAASPVTWWAGPKRSFSGTPNPNCVADLYFGYLQGGYWYSGGLDEWFYEKDSDLTMEDLEFYIRSVAETNGGNTDTDVSRVDPYTSPGALGLKIDSSTGKYFASGIFYSRVIDLQAGFLGTGQIKLSIDTTVGVTDVRNIQTRTSEDLTNWSPWSAVDSDGAINSPNYRYLQIQVELATADPNETPLIFDIQIHDVPRPPYTRLGFARPVIIHPRTGERLAVLENAYDIILTEELNGENYLEFKIPFRDPKRQFIINEYLVQLTTAQYRIRKVTDDKDSSGKIITSVYAEAAFYDLAYSPPIEPMEFTEAPPVQAMNYALKGTGWSVGTVTVNRKRTWSISQRTNTLAVLRDIQNIYGGDLIFDNASRTVSLLESSAVDRGVLFAYRKNMKSIQRITDTGELITRLYPYGKDDLTISQANDGVPYIEDYTYTNELRAQAIKNDSFTSPYQLKEWAEERLAELSRPRVSYSIKVMDLSVLTGWEHETFELGDIVTVDDQELGIRIKTRIVKRYYNVQEPWKTTIELSTKLRELGDAAMSWQQSSSALESAETVDRQDIAQLMVFNYLLNSRADDGFAYWVNSGFTIDNTNGFSGPASFKAVGVPGAAKSLLQTVYPAHRENYTISARIATQNLKKGANGRVGIEVTLYYEDGSTETKFLEL